MADNFKALLDQKLRNHLNERKKQVFEGFLDDPTGGPMVAQARANIQVFDSPSTTTPPDDQAVRASSSVDIALDDEDCDEDEDEGLDENYKWRGKTYDSIAELEKAARKVYPDAQVVGVKGKILQIDNINLKLDEAIFGAERYQYYKFKGDHFPLQYRGKAEDLERGDIFGIRPATSKRDTSRIILPMGGKTRVLSIPDEDKDMLVKNSMIMSGAAKSTIMQTYFENVNEHIGTIDADFWAQYGKKKEPEKKKKEADWSEDDKKKYVDNINKAYGKNEEVEQLEEAAPGSVWDNIQQAAGRSASSMRVKFANGEEANVDSLDAKLIAFKASKLAGDMKQKFIAMLNKSSLSFNQAMKYALQESAELVDEEQIDEISGKVLGAYIQGARKDFEKKRQHSQELSSHPSVKKITDKRKEYYDRREYDRHGRSKHQDKINKTYGRETAAKEKLDPNYPKSVDFMKRHRGIDKAIKKLQSGKLTEAKEFEIVKGKEKLGLPAGTYIVGKKVDDSAHSGPWGSFSYTEVKNKATGKTYQITTGNAQLMGLI